MLEIANTISSIILTLTLPIALIAAARIALRLVRQREEVRKERDGRFAELLKTIPAIMANFPQEKHAHQSTAAQPLTKLRAIVQVRSHATSEGKADPSEDEQNFIDHLLPIEAKTATRIGEMTQAIGRSMISGTVVRVIVEDEDAWQVEDLRIGNRSLLAGSGQFPSSLLWRVPDLSLGPIAVGKDFSIIASRRDPAS